MRKTKTIAVIAALPAMFLAGCVATTAPTVTETRAAVCPTPMTQAQRVRASDAIDVLPAGRELDFLAGQLERLDDGSRICRGL